MGVHDMWRHINFSSIGNNLYRTEIRERKPRGRLSDHSNLTRVWASISVQKNEMFLITNKCKCQECVFTWCERATFQKMRWMTSKGVFFHCCCQQPLLQWLRSYVEFLKNFGSFDLDLDFGRGLENQPDFELAKTNL